MSSYSDEREASVVVATAPTIAAAELIKVTLAAHGFDATISPAFPAYPAVDFVQQLRVSVSPDVASAVRGLLENLGLGAEDT